MDKLYGLWAGHMWATREPGFGMPVICVHPQELAAYLYDPEGEKGGLEIREINPDGSPGPKFGEQKPGEGIPAGILIGQQPAAVNIRPPDKSEIGQIAYQYYHRIKAQEGPVMQWQIRDAFIAGAEWAVEQIVAQITGQAAAQLHLPAGKDGCDA